VRLEDELEELPDVLDKNLYLEVHGGFVLVFLVVAIVLVLAVDSVAEQLQKP